MSLCDEASFTCGDFDIRNVSSTEAINISHTKNRMTELLINDVSILLNKRVRGYTYTQNKSTIKSDYKLIFIVEDQVFVDCYTINNTDIASIADSYQTVDAEIKYIDLRNDIVVYEQTDVTMTYQKSGNSTLVNVRGTYGDAHMHPFIFNGAPITGTKKLIYNKAGVEEVLHEEVVIRGYGGEMNLLMPQFDAGDPYGVFVYGGNTYDAAQVEWYYIPTHRVADGGMDLYWPDWLKAVSSYTELDAREAAARWDSIMGYIPNPATIAEIETVPSAQVFTGSVAVSVNGDVFLSVEVPQVSTNPTGEKNYTNKIYGTAQTLNEIFSPEGVTYFPVAPIKFTVKKEQLL